MTLLSNVTLSDVIKLSSTEHHTLNLGTYTMTAASGKNAIEITCAGRSSASYALTINANAENPGGITATGKSCIYYNKSGSTKDRPIIVINNCVFNGSYSINCTSNGNTNCPQFWINGGIFKAYMNLTKTLLKVTGGYFDCAINCTGDQNAYRLFSGGTFKQWQFMTSGPADNGEQKNGAYNMITVDELVSADGRVPVTCEVYDAEGNVVAWVTESLESYVARYAEALPWLYEIMKYSDSARDYLN